MEKSSHREKSNSPKITGLAAEGQGLGCCSLTPKLNVLSQHTTLSSSITSQRDMITKGSRAVEACKRKDMPAKGTGPQGTRSGFLAHIGFKLH